MKIGVVGLWHLGCIIATSWAKLGNEVIGFDYDENRVKNLKGGDPPLFEPGLKESITTALAAKTLSFTTSIADLSECDFVFLSYDTPVREDDSTDATVLTDSVNDLKEILKSGAVLIVSSQSPAGFCSELRGILKKANPAVDIAYSPENLRLGEALQCYMQPGRIILGTADAKTEIQCRKLFSQINADLLCMNLESAEMVKHGINSFLANSVVFANHLAEICESNGAIIDDVVRGMKTDPRIGAKAYLSPGVGFSGGTLGRDLRVLQSINDSNNGFAKLFGLIHQLNGERKIALVQRIKKITGTLQGKKIAVLGVTYKPGTSTLRRSLPLEIVDVLINEGATVKVFDPKADFSELNTPFKFLVCTSVPEALQKSDLAILLTEWSEFKQIDWKLAKGQMSRPTVFDTKNFLDRNVIIAAGFKYYSVGR
ncbi:MAG: nucleotide sugar dehydrogenase [Bacteroidota bacterium]